MKQFKTRSHFVKHHKKLFNRQLLGILLLIVLPLFVWAVMQQTELRKRATDSTTVCWDRVIQTGDTYQWPDGCKGNPTVQNCIQILTPLTTDEITSYNEWVASGKQPITGCVLVTPTPTPTDSITSTPTPTPTSEQTLKFNVKLAGVTDDKAQGAKITVKFMLDSGVTMQLSDPLMLTHTGNGVYATQAELANPLPPGIKFTLLIKGEKHVAVKFCRQVGQSGPCGSTEVITVPDPSPLSYGFDLTGIELPPGDLYLQDGMANKSDFDKLTARMSKLCSALTDEDKLIADLDYNGCVNVRDVFLMKQTLETRYDEQ